MRALGGRLNPRKDRATIVAFSGDLGAGKTTCVQALAQEFGVKESVTSPTFILQRSYNLSNISGKYRRLVHIDAYRLTREEELQALGWEEIVQDPGTLVLVEWPERIEGRIPHDAVHVSLSYVDDDSRKLTYDY
jgi:tRNA threonylcarbamoyladenosine biosynthesis protein TsaE